MQIRARFQNLKSQLIITTVVSLVMFMEFLDITIINTAIPSIARDFVINPILLKFSVASYLLSLAIFIPISGWCADKFGTKSIFLLSITIFTVASFLCGIAHNSTQLTIFRFMQGIGGAFMNPVARIIILRLFPPKELLKVQSIIFTPALLGYVLGPFLGGILTSYLSWHWIFYVNIPFGLLAIYLGQKHIIQYINPQLKKFDLLGFIIAGLGLFTITFFVEMLNHYEIISQKFVFLAGYSGISLLVLLVIYCLKKPNSIFNFSLFKIKTFRVGFSTYLSTSATVSSISFLLPLMYQENFHFTPAKSGVLTLPISLGFVCARAFASKIINRFGFKRILSINLLLLTLWVICFTQITFTSSIYYIVLIEFLFGISLILVNACAGALNYLDIPPTQTATATAMDLTLRQFSASLGIGMSAFCLTSFTKYLSLDIFDIQATIFHYTYYIIAAITFVGWISTRQLNSNDGTHALKKKIKM